MLARRPYLRFLLFSCVTAWTGGAKALVVADTPRCRVTLVAASYDDPDGDDAEFLELFVERTAPSSGDAGTSSPDASSSTGDSTLDSGDASIEAGLVPAQALADCGLGSIELMNGGSGACDRYRNLAVGSVPVPADGYVVICATDSSLATGGHCDASTFGSTILKNGWLQNGPSDGIRFRSTSGVLLSEIGYEAGPACFTSVEQLADETGSLAGEDDVNILCDDGYRLVTASAAPLREHPSCRPPQAPDAGAADSAARAPVATGGTAPWVPEYAPPIASGGASAIALSGGAGGSPATQGGQSTARLPRAPSCAVSGGRSLPSAVATMIASSWLALWPLRRRTLPRCSPRRARFLARSGSSRPR